MNLRDRKIRVLVVDDERSIQRSWVHFLNPQQGEFQVYTAFSGSEAIQLLQSYSIDVLVTDIRMEGMTGIELLKYSKRHWPEVEVILMTAHGSVEDAISAIQSGAFHYLTKPFIDIKECIHKVRQAAQIKALREENRALREGKEPDLLKSQSPQMLPIINTIERVSRANVPVLITGPSGSGKTVIAKEIHRLSDRAFQPFVVIDCGVSNPNLIESELFGQIPGAFSEAQRRKGLIAEAHKGTLFLDEIGNLPFHLQPRFLRILSEKTFRPLGSNQEIDIDVRVLSATNMDLQEAVKQGRFRKDLLFRLKVAEIKMPPLRERREDIPSLAVRILHSIGSSKQLSPEFLERLMNYSWPGNIRELFSELQMAVLSEPGQSLKVSSLSPELQAEPEQPTYSERLPSSLVDLSKPWKQAKRESLRQVQIEYLSGLMERYTGNLTQCARHAGIDRSNFRRWLKQNIPDYQARFKKG